MSGAAELGARRRLVAAGYAELAFGEELGALVPADDRGRVVADAEGDRLHDLLPELEALAVRRLEGRHAEAHAPGQHDAGGQALILDRHPNTVAEPHAAVGERAVLMRG